MRPGSACNSFALILVAVALVTAAMCAPYAQLPTVVAALSTADSVRHAGLAPEPLFVASSTVKRFDTPVITADAGVAQCLRRLTQRTTIDSEPLARQAPEASFRTPLRI